MIILRIFFLYFNFFYSEDNLRNFDRKATKDQSRKKTDENSPKSEHLIGFYNNKPHFIVLQDFGDYSDSYYSVQTIEGEQISQLIAGYIDIILKKVSVCRTF